MKTTIIWGPAGSGKTMIADGISRALELPRHGGDGTPVLVLDAALPEDLKRTTRELKKLISGKFPRKYEVKKTYKWSHLVIICNERPPDEVLQKINYVIETRSNPSALEEMTRVEVADKAARRSK